MRLILPQKQAPIHGGLDVPAADLFLERRRHHPEWIPEFGERLLHWRLLASFLADFHLRLSLVKWWTIGTPAANREVPDQRSRRAPAGQRGPDSWPRRSPRDRR